MITMKDAKGIDIRVGDQGEVTDWKPERGTSANMLRLDATVISIGHTRITIEIPDMRRFRSGTVHKTIGPETFEVCTYMRDE